MQRGTLTAVIAGCVLVVGSCGGDDGQGESAIADVTASSAAERDEADGAATPPDGQWSGETELGMTLHAELWVDATDPDLAPFEAYRTAVDAPVVSYVRIVADNSDGSTDDTGRFLTFTDATGDLFGPSRVEAPFLCSVLSTRWAPGGDAAAETIEQYGELFNGPCADRSAQVVVPAGETATYFVAVEGEPPDFERVFAGAGNELSP